MLFAFLSMLTMAISTLILGYLLMHAPILLVTPVWYGAGFLAAFLVIIWRKHVRRDTMCFALYKNHTVPMVFWGVINGACWLLSIYFLGVSGNIIIARLQLVISLVIGASLYKESLTIKQIALCLLISIAGFIFAFDTESETSWLGIGLSIINSISIIIFSLHQKHISSEVDSLYIFMIRALIITLFASALLFSFRMDIMYDLPWDMIGLTIFGGILSAVLSHYLTTKAFKNTYYTTVTLIKSLGMVITFLAAILILGETATQMKWAAAIIAIMATILLTLNKTNEAKTKSENSSSKKIDKKNKFKLCQILGTCE